MLIQPEAEALPPSPACPDPNYNYDHKSEEGTERWSVAQHNRVGSTGNGLLSCLEVDDAGQVFHGRYVKNALCLLHGLQPRDLRKLDGTLKNQLPAILVRPRSLLVHLSDGIRAIITHNRVTLFEAADGGVVEELRQRLGALPNSPGGLPFEFVALEIMLNQVGTALQEEMESLAPYIEEQLTLLERSVHWDKLRVLLVCKKRVNAMLTRANSFRDCLHEVLESDLDMANMYLSHRAMTHLPQRPIAAHEEVELLLESYLKTAEEISMRATTLEQNIQSTGEIVNIGLVNQRNELLLLELKLGIGTFAASMGGFGASLLGMNLMNHLEHSPLAFYGVLSLLLMVSGSAFGLAWRRMGRLLRYHFQR
jgi:magnesium transporter